MQAEPRPYVVDVQISTPEQDGDYYTSLLRLLLNASEAPDEVIELENTFLPADTPLHNHKYWLDLFALL